MDTDRIAILGDNWSSSFVARGIAFDRRCAAAVCDGGIWDAHERAFLRKRAFSADRGLCRGDVARGSGRGFDNLAASVKYKFYQSDEHETLLSAGIDWDIGGSG